MYCFWVYEIHGSPPAGEVLMVRTVVGVGEGGGF